MPKHPRNKDGVYLSHGRPPKKRDPETSNIQMSLCAIVWNGIIRGVVPVRIDHDFGPRDKGYSHLKVKLLTEMPEKYNDPVST